MKIKDYLFEKLYFILLGLLTYAIIVLFLYGIGNNTQAIMVVSLLYWGMLLAVSYTHLDVYKRQYTYNCIDDSG